MHLIHALNVLDKLYEVVEGGEASIACKSIPVTVNAICICLQVHRYDPPLIYGRSMTGEPQDSHGFAIYEMRRESEASTAYAFISFR